MRKLRPGAVEAEHNNSRHNNSARRLHLRSETDAAEDRRYRRVIGAVFWRHRARVGKHVHIIVAQDLAYKVKLQYLQSYLRAIRSMRPHHRRIGPGV